MYVLYLGTLLGVYVVFRRNKKKMGDLVRNPRMRSAAMMGFQALLLGTGDTHTTYIASVTVKNTLPLYVCCP